MEKVKDGTQIKHEAAVTNANVQKEELRARTTSLNEKIQHGDWIRTLKEHPGWKLVEASWQRKYPYESVVEAYTKGGNSKEVDKVIFGRAAIDDTYKFINFIQEVARKASEQLAREDK